MLKRHHIFDVTKDFICYVFLRFSRKKLLARHEFGDAKGINIMYLNGLLGKLNAYTYIYIYTNTQLYIYIYIFIYIFIYVYNTCVFVYI